MRWCVHLSGEHGEGLESRERFEEIVREFRVKLEVNGFEVEAHACCLDDMANVPVVDAAEINKYGPESPSFCSSGVFKGRFPYYPEPEIAVEASGEGEEAEEPLIERIERLEAAAENAHMSQRELADALGVTVYQIRKAKKGVG